MLKRPARIFYGWQFVLAIGCRNAADTGIIVHLIPLLVWKGLAESRGLWLLGLMAFTTFFMRPTAGWLGDRWSRPKVSAIGMLIGGLSVGWLLACDGQLWQLAVFAILLGCAESINAVGWAILGGFFGRQNFATLRGCATLVARLLPEKQEERRPISCMVLGKSPNVPRDV